MLHIKGTVVLDTLKAIEARAGKAELEKITSHLDPETQKIFQGTISPSSWYSCGAFARFLEADIRETAGGNEQELVKRAEAVIEKQLSGIYKMFVRLGSPEFVILGFFRKALEISGAKKIDVRFSVPIEAGEKFCELALRWD